MLREMQRRLEPILKWPGGKTGELDVILPELPTFIERYFEPFLGGGAVFLAMPDNVSAYLNDISSDLIRLYRNVASNDSDFFQMLCEIDSSWKLLSNIVESNRDSILKLYLGYRQREFNDQEVKRGIQQFIDANLVQLNGILSESFIYNAEHFIREVRISLREKIKRMREIEDKRGIMPLSDILDNFEGALKSALYMHFRHLYNYPEMYDVVEGHYSSIFYFIRENAYASMFRFNRQGKFNVPYGGIAYNRKNLGNKIARMQSYEIQNRFQKAIFENMDFYDFLEKHQPASNDFLFLDPPYDTEFSSYDKNSFNQDDQARLANYLDNCPANFMVVIKATDYILSLYKGKGLNIRHFEKTYMYTVKERNNRKATHLMITNY